MHRAPGPARMRARHARRTEQFWSSAAKAADRARLLYRRDKNSALSRSEFMSNISLHRHHAKSSPLPFGTPLRCRVWGYVSSGGFVVESSSLGRTHRQVLSHFQITRFFPLHNFRYAEFRALRFRIRWLLSADNKQTRRWLSRKFRELFKSFTIQRDRERERERDRESPRSRRVRSEYKRGTCKKKKKENREERQQLCQERSISRTASKWLFDGRTMLPNAEL